MVVLTEIGPMSTAKIQAAISVVVRIIVAGIYVFLGVMEVSLWLFAIPLLYAAIGFLVGGFSAWLYNALAEVLGGIELKFENE